MFISSTKQTILLCMRGQVVSLISRNCILRRQTQNINFFIKICNGVIYISITLLGQQVRQKINYNLINFVGDLDCLNTNFDNFFVEDDLMQVKSAAVVVKALIQAVKQEFLLFVECQAEIFVTVVQNFHLFHHACKIDGQFCQ